MLSGVGNVLGFGQLLKAVGEKWRIGRVWGVDVVQNVQSS